MTDPLFPIGDLMNYRAMETMRALTIRQPWAHAIMTLGKDVENRTWATPHRGLVVVHAGQVVDRHAGMKVPGDLARGALLGVVELVDVRRDAPSPWACPGHYHWVLARPQPFAEPIPCRGRQLLWSLDTATTRRVQASLTRG